MDKLRVGVVGLGSVVREIYRHLYYSSEYSSMLDIAAVCDVNEKALEEFGEEHGIPASRRFRDYKKMVDTVELDALHVNTPDDAHMEPTVYGLTAGLDVLVPKPTAHTVQAAHTMIQTAREKGRLLGIDFHKRDDPRVKEAKARYQSGRYGTWQIAVWYMLDKLLVADPNHEPRFFASPDFASRNSPISFLTVHMADAFIYIVGTKPVSVRARGFKQKLPFLKPIAVDGYDCVDTEIVFENGGVAHIITGWHIPNGAYTLTMQESRMICTDGVIDLALDMPGYSEVTEEGTWEASPLFRSFGTDGKVTGYGMARPGEILRQLLQYRQGNLEQEEINRMMTPQALGFFTTLVLQGAEESLKRGGKTGEGVVQGVDVDLRELLEKELGKKNAAFYME